MSKSTFILFLLLGFAFWAGKVNCQRDSPTEDPGSGSGSGDATTPTVTADGTTQPSDSASTTVPGGGLESSTTTSPPGGSTGQPDSTEQPLVLPGPSDSTPGDGTSTTVSSTSTTSVDTSSTTTTPGSTDGTTVSTTPGGTTDSTTVSTTPGGSTDSTSVSSTPSSTTDGTTVSSTPGGSTVSDSTTPVTTTETSTTPVTTTDTPTTESPILRQCLYKGSFLLSELRKYYGRPFWVSQEMLDDRRYLYRVLMYVRSKQNFLFSVPCKWQDKAILVSMSSNDAVINYYKQWSDVNKAGLTYPLYLFSISKRDAMLYGDDLVLFAYGLVKENVIPNILIKIIQNEQELYDSVYWGNVRCFGLEDGGRFCSNNMQDNEVTWQIGETRQTTNTDITITVSSDATNTDITTTVPSETTNTPTSTIEPTTNHRTIKVLLDTSSPNNCMTYDLCVYPPNGQSMNAVFSWLGQTTMTPSTGVMQYYITEGSYCPNVVTYQMYFLPVSMLMTRWESIQHGLQTVKIPSNDDAQKPQDWCCVDGANPIWSACPLTELPEKSVKVKGDFYRTYFESETTVRSDRYTKETQFDNCIDK